MRSHDDIGKVWNEGLLGLFALIGVAAQGFELFVFEILRLSILKS